MIPIKFDMSRLQTAIYFFLHDTDHVADVDDDERCIIYLIMLSALSLSQIMGFMRHLIFNNANNSGGLSKPCH